MATRKETNIQPIPVFKDEAEAAVFWDTHSPEDYPGDFEELPIRFSRPLINRGLTVKLNDETVGKLRQIARRKGIGPSTLVRMWVLEHLEQEVQTKSTTS